MYRLCWRQSTWCFQKVFICCTRLIAWPSHLPPSFLGLWCSLRCQLLEARASGSISSSSSDAQVCRQQPLSRRLQTLIKPSPADQVGYQPKT
ncbi:hypothetical protein EJ08DRAFT_165949 [Tothia fuscella]|uniref:Uncharacterized protein n=1 Tax=Tothia fuscella TaxID=1048955 RepID=A0A9P4U0D8_9PEZI|nr:hypothetical protein EJ08DRAFT_165949 [Tothia fuscella]